MSSSPYKTLACGDAAVSQSLPSWYFVPGQWFSSSPPWARGIIWELAGHSNSQASLLTESESLGVRPGSLGSSKPPVTRTLKFQDHCSMVTVTIVAAIMGPQSCPLN